MKALAKAAAKLAEARAAIERAAGESPAMPTCWGAQLDALDDVAAFVARRIAAAERRPKMGACHCRGK